MTPQTKKLLKLATYVGGGFALYNGLPFFDIMPPEYVGMLTGAVWGAKKIEESGTGNDTLIKNGSFVAAGGVACMVGGMILPLVGNAVDYVGTIGLVAGGYEAGKGWLEKRRNTLR